MKNGKYGRKAGKKRMTAVLVSVALICTLAIGATIAWLVTQTEGITNTFEPSQVTSLVVEDKFKGENKSNVKIQNTGDISAYIRADIVVNWMDESGNVYGKEPVEGTDYEIDMGDKWFEKDGFWYWPDVVAPNGLTGNLIDSADDKGTVTFNGTTYYISIEIVSSAIQSVPEEAVEGAWDVTVENGVIKNN